MIPMQRRRSASCALSRIPIADQENSGYGVRHVNAGHMKLASIPMVPVSLCARTVILTTRISRTSLTHELTAEFAVLA